MPKTRNQRIGDVGYDDFPAFKSTSLKKIGQTHKKLKPSRDAERKTKKKTKQTSEMKGEKRRYSSKIEFYFSQSIEFKSSISKIKL
jgi:hypothetical protein